VAAGLRPCQRAVQRQLYALQRHMVLHSRFYAQMQQQLLLWQLWQCA
jgi:hypothetical protein